MVWLFICDGRSMERGQSACPACRVQRLQGVAGSRLDLERVLGQALAGDFDPAQYDAAMASAFGDDYYEVSAQSTATRAAQAVSARQALETHGSP